MKYCRHCGFTNDDDAKYCNKCGGEIEPQAKPSPQTTTHKRLIWSVIISLLIVVAVGATVWRLKDAGFKIGSDSEKTETKPAEDQETTTKKPELNIPKSPAEAQETIAKAADKVVGSDEKVSKNIPKDQPNLNPGDKDVDYSKNYSYTDENCNKLFTDIAQQVGYTIDGELAKATSMSEKDENELGKELAKEVAQQFSGKLDVDKQWLSYIQKLGAQLTQKVERKGINYHFHVINDDVVNAFAIPGGGVYFFTGILERVKNEAQLATIVGHEIKHVDLRHCIAVFQVISKLPEAFQNEASVFIASMMRHPFNSRTEAAADRAGLELIYTVGYSPYQSVKFWDEEIEEQKAPQQQTNKEDNPIGDLVGQVIDEVENVINTHPDSKKRACLLRNHIIKLQKELPREFFYVGKWNYENRVTMFEKQM
jgi:hypothetical protein